MAWKLSRHVFSRYWDVHAWTGVLAGLLLYLMTVCGAVTLFHEELAVWEEPLAQSSSRATLQAIVEQSFSVADPRPTEIWLYPPRGERGSTKLAYQSFEGKWQTAWFDADTLRLVPERERLSAFIYELHFLWHDATGDWLYRIAGFVAVALLFAIVTGVLIHLKDIVRQFHQFRPHKSRRVLWSDLHKVLGVMGLPFQTMYAYTGAFIVLSPLALQALTGPVFQGDERRAQAMAWGLFDQPTEPGPRLDVLAVDELVERAQAAVPSMSIESLKLSYHGHANGALEAWGDIEGTFAGHGAVRVRETDGFIEGLETPETEGIYSALRRYIEGLHFADFGGPALRILFFLLGLATCATILTGNWIWLARRCPSPSSRVLSRLTVGLGAGTWVALGALFLVSRLLPRGWGSRGSAEELVFFGALSACIAWALAVRREASLWSQQLGLAGLLFAPVPILQGSCSDAGFFGSGPSIASVVAVDVGVLIVATALCATGLGLRRASHRGSSVAGASAEVDGGSALRVKVH